MLFEWGVRFCSFLFSEFLLFFLFVVVVLVFLFFLFLRMTSAAEKARISEWVDSLEDCKCLSENDMKQLCDIVCTFFFFFFFFLTFF